MKLPDNFASYAEAKKTAFLKMKELKDQGNPVVGIFCTYTPTELIMAAGAIPIGLCAGSDEPIAAAESHLPKNLCPLIKSSYGFALTDTCPFFYFSDMVVGETTCDGKKKMYELLDEIKFTHVMQLPQTRDNERALSSWTDEMFRLKEVLEEKLAVKITEEDIKEAIRKKNHERDTLRRFYELGKLNPSLISGYEINTRMDSFSFDFDLDNRCRVISGRIDEVMNGFDKTAKPSDRPRILLTGCPTIGVREKIIKTIEDMGADVVAFENCSGIREKLDLVDEDLPVMQALAKKYLNINCSVMSPNQKRLNTLGEMIDEYQVDGVLEVVLQACHTFNVESYYVKKFVREEKNLPYLMIETDYSKSDSGQINTRLSAFLETINK